MSQAQLEKKVADYLRDPQALKHSQRLIMADQLQAEMDRMAQHTKQPEMLRELFEALGNDPFVIAECLARPILADRLRARSCCSGRRVACAKEFICSQHSCLYRQPNWRDNERRQRSVQAAANLSSARLRGRYLGSPTAAPPEIRESHTGVWTGSEMIVWGGIPGRGQMFEYGRKIQSRHRYVDSNEHHSSA